MRGRLSLLMFLLYGTQGAFLPIFSLRLKELGFSPLEIGAACATQPLALLTAPLVAGQVADRWFPAERCLAVCGLGGGLLLWLLAGLRTFPAVFLASLLFWLVLGPGSTLVNAVCFAHLGEPERDFGRVRLWGTLGWVAAGLGLGAWLILGSDPKAPPANLADAFRLAGLLAMALAGYALTLPRTPPRRRAGASWLAPLAALRRLSGRSFNVYWFCTFGVCLTIPFSGQVGPLLLEHLGIPHPWVGPTLTISQSMEVISLALLPVILVHLGFRGTMLLGLGAWALLLAVMTLGRPAGLVVGALSLNGLCISCFIVAGQVFVNGRAPGDVRASAQALLLSMNGLGMLTGHLLAGWVRHEAGGAFAPTFGVAAAVAFGLTAGFAAGFREAEADAGPADEPAASPLAAPERH